MPKYRQIKPLKTTEKNISSGLIFHQETIHLNNRLTNLYWLKLNTTKYKFALKTRLQPKPLIDYQLKNRKVAAGINFASFYLSDELNQPKSTFYNLLFNKGKILQFPSNNRTALLIKRGQLNHKKIKAKGTISINNQAFTWSGSHIKSSKTDITAYGLFDIQLEKHISNTVRKREISKNSNFIICPKDHLLLGCTLKKR